MRDLMKECRTVITIVSVWNEWVSVGECAVWGI